MISSTRKNIMPEAVKPQAAAPNFVLSLLAACSSSVPAAGKEGEATLLEQLSGLLQGKAMDLAELNLTYNYKFGLSIADALKFIGFDGKLEDFAVKQKCFSIHDGCISLVPVDVAICEELSAVDKPAAPKDCGTGRNDEARAGESTDEGEEDESDAESDIDVRGWQSIGNRLKTAFDYSSDDESCEADVDAPALLGCRIAVALHDGDDEERVDVDAWRNVGGRFAAACKRFSDEDDDDDAEGFKL